MKEFFAFAAAVFAFLTSVIRLISTIKNTDSSTVSTLVNANMSNPNEVMHASSGKYTRGDIFWFIVTSASLALAFSVGFTREPVTNASLIAIGCGFTTVLMMLGDAWLKLTIRRMKVIEDNQLRMFQQSLRVEHVHLKTNEALASRLLGDDTSTDEN